MDTIVGQPNPTSRPTTTNAYVLQSNGFYFPKSTCSTHLPPQSQLPSIHSPSSTSGFSQTRLLGSKPLPTHQKLTDVELQSKIAKGLCFLCDAKFSLEQRCKYRELQVLVVQEDSTEIEVPPQGSPNDPLEEEIHEVAELSLKYVVSLSTPKTMNVRGKIKQQEVIVLINCEATHNFIFAKLVCELVLPLEGTLGYGVLMGIGAVVKGEGVYRGVILAFQNIEIVEDFLPLELGSANVIHEMVKNRWVECKWTGGTSL